MNKKFDSVKMQRDIRTKISKEIVHLSKKEILEYFRTKPPLRKGAVAK